MIDKTKYGQIGRLAMRKEGNLWNAYYALPGTMRKAIYLGGIQLRFVSNEERKRLFMDLMREAVGDIIEEKCGVRPTWGGLEHAPEHERSGNG